MPSLKFSVCAKLRKQHKENCICFYATEFPNLTKQVNASRYSLNRTIIVNVINYFSVHQQHGPVDPFPPSAEEKEQLLNVSNSSSSQSARSATTSVAINEPKTAHELSTTYVVVSDPHSSQPVDHMPSLRVRSEELQRSVSSPQVCLSIWP